VLDMSGNGACRRVRGGTEAVQPRAGLDCAEPTSGSMPARLGLTNEVQRRAKRVRCNAGLGGTYPFLV